MRSASKSPKLSVLLSAFNAEKFIEQTIKSILDQTFRNFELVIADDGSHDMTRSIIDDFKMDSRVRTFHNSVNLGKTKTISRLYKQAKGEYLTIHDADDYSIDTRFQKQVEFLDKHTEIVMVGTSFRSVKANGKTFQKVTMPADYDLIKSNIKNSSQFHGPTMVIRKQIVDKNLKGELLRPFFKDYNEDCDLAMRLTECGKCMNLSDFLYVYRILPNSLSKSLDARKKCLYPMVVHFHNQRKRYGYDDLMMNKQEVAERKLGFLMSKNYKEKSKIYRERAAFQMYYHLYGPAISSSIRGTILEPWSLKNWGTLQYCLRKALLKI